MVFPKLLFIFILSLAIDLHLFAETNNAKPPPPPPPPGTPGNNNVIDEDPFLDYSEFESDPEQERDEQFFRHGRFFMLTFEAGHTNWTSNLGSLYSSSILNTFGGKLTYFFDLHWAIDLGFYTSKHDYIVVDNANPVNDIGSVDVRLSRMLLTPKYYFDTRNINATIAILNPYAGIGVGSYYRKQTFIDLSYKTVSDSMIGFSPVLGIEYPFRDKSVYLNVEARYSFVTFSDETDTSLEDSGIPTLDGDPWDFLVGLSLCW